MLALLPSGRVIVVLIVSDINCFVPFIVLYVDLVTLFETTMVFPALSVWIGYLVILVFYLR